MFISLIHVIDLGIFKQRFSVESKYLRAVSFGLCKKSVHLVVFEERATIAWGKKVLQLKRQTNQLQSSYLTISSLLERSPPRIELLGPS